MDMEEDDEINWQDYVDPAYSDVSLYALSYSVTRRIGYMLNGEKAMVGDYVPNFGGVADLVGFDSDAIRTFELTDKNPGLRVLNEWKDRQDLDKKPTIGNLMKILAVLEREDIITDCHNKINEDAAAFLQRKKKLELQNEPIQDETVSQGPGHEEVPAFITRDDLDRGAQTYYDAFVCFNPMGDSEKDIEFVRAMIERLEGPPHNFKLFVPYRDDLAGLSRHTIDAAIISERCRHMIVVLSKNFLQSDSCEFQSTFAHSLSPGALNRRVIPIRIEEIPKMPNILRVMACCDFTKKELWDWSWDRLARSISLPLQREDYQVQSVQSKVNMSDLIAQTPMDLSLSVSRSVSRSDSGFESNAPSRQISIASSTPSHLPAYPTDSPMRAQSSTNSSLVENSLPEQEPQSLQNTAVVEAGKKGKTPSSPSLGSRTMKKIKDTLSSSSKKKAKQQT